MLTNRIRQKDWVDQQGSRRFRIDKIKRINSEQMPAKRRKLESPSKPDEKDSKKRA